MHILGYGVDPENPALKNLTETLLAGRDNRNPRIVEKLNEIGVAVTMKEWEDEAEGRRPRPAASRGDPASQRLRLLDQAGVRQIHRPRRRRRISTRNG